MRYAIYFTPPPDSLLTEFASHWLRRDAFTGAALDPAKFWKHLPVGHEQIVKSPARYGFHATIKAPFRLKDGTSEEDLLTAFEAFCAKRSAFFASPLSVETPDGFLALMQRSPSGELDALASEAVTAFEPYRAPPLAEEIARRKPERLTPRQRAHLERWGYPYVLDDFQFHMTLTDRVPANEAENIRELLVAGFDYLLAVPLQVAGLAIFKEPELGADFTVVAYRPFGIDTSNQ